MELIAKTRLVLTPHKEEFEYQFSWNKKRGVDKDYWFTPTGKCKIWIGSLHNNTVGEVSESEYKKLIKELKRNKCDAFSWGRDFYTTGGENKIIEISNLSQIFYQARNEWDKRKYIEFWVDEV